MIPTDQRHRLSIDGLGSDAVWASTAAVHGFSEFNIVTTEAGPLSGPADLSVFWKGLWDDTNLYLYAEVTDDVIVSDDSCNYEDDGIEFYIDAQERNVTDFRPAGHESRNPGLPVHGDCRQQH